MTQPIGRLLLALGTVALLLGWSASAQMSDFLPKPPQDRRPVEAQQAFDAGRFGEAARIYEAYLQDQPDNAEAWLFLGWSRYRLGEFREAREAFLQTQALTPDSVDAEVALGYTALQASGPEAAADYFRPVIAEHPERTDALQGMVLAGRRANAPPEIVQAGTEAAKLLETREGRDIETLLASTTLEAGKEKKLRPEPLAGPLRVPFRAGDRYLEQATSDDRWLPLFVKGVNVVAGLPGRTATEAPADESLYREWLAFVASLGANTVRVNALFPPAFYQALNWHNGQEDQSPLWLIQGIWAEQPANDDFNDPGYSQAVQAEIRRTIDAIHGNIGIGPRASHAWGAYDSDVSIHLLAYTFGQQWSPNTVQTFNAYYPEQTAWQGRWVTTEGGAAMEVWLAQMLDYAAAYESEQYRMLHPLTFTNWPTLDPLTHPTEPTLAEENAIREGLGLPPLAPESQWDDDAVSVDANHLTATPAMEAGLFASYNAFPHSPDFMIQEYGDSRDGHGPSPFLGYLQALRGYHRGQPLMITEFGLSTSQGVAHLHPAGWHHGGMDEREQARINGRIMQNLYATGYAGGVIFSLMDEWYRSTWNVSRYEMAEHGKEWFNAESPAESFGILAVRPGGSAIRLDGTFADWDSIPAYARD